MDEDLQPWLEAARGFQMNRDFDISAHLGVRPLTLSDIIAVMKKNSGGKRTIQALGDKIALSQMLENLGVPQMPMLFQAQGQVERRAVDELVETLTKGGEEELAIVAKPTHLSNCSGAVVLSKGEWASKGWNADKLYDHMTKYMAERALDSESEALKSVKRGFIVQPLYRSCVDFTSQTTKGHKPLEMRVITLWGKARIGVWWWGRYLPGRDDALRTTWIVRRPKQRGVLSDDDDWEIAHMHQGHNPGYEASLRLFKQAMPTMALAAEAIATAVGAPFLRSDFFIGSERWGVRLNEVAYGSGLDYKRRPAGVPGLLDDSPVMARILQEGFRFAKCASPETFLDRLGAEGSTYEALTVGEVAPDQRPRLPSAVLRSPSLEDDEMLPTLLAGGCETVRPAKFPLGFPRCISNAAPFPAWPAPVPASRVNVNVNVGAPPLSVTSAGTRVVSKVSAAPRAIPAPLGTLVNVPVSPPAPRPTVVTAWASGSPLLPSSPATLATTSTAATSILPQWTSAAPVCYPVTSARLVGVSGVRHVAVPAA
eukprot:TRINITY_DN12246_c0_g1_i1.p1 TRINITY_DN12246_c0_g1~~TRINITY_DN12246_c0_g1_i1.p1  ORF type:complete len:584 (+),score=83.08 TRINITY_DN12246_c0_g1_i1:137-1753(+)